MDNKEAIERLTEYYLTQDPAIICKALASAQIDINRFMTANQLDEKQRKCLIYRSRLLIKEIQKFLKNGPKGNIKIHNITIK